ncbi:acyl-CoA synthetase [Agitococcus lubricus]|uniref:Fatty-acyl-CoA synthase n=1 Tax=Agitococcus lubricus TaxID=1077255 RepID=A0A2T5IZP1_9GAMM|nr:acyl-CoA synthetase [Agitococcus lubricus]PTQ89502.1 fatty-acyl-CoA synthase [Agitococcus lubricus]
MSVRQLADIKALESVPLANHNLPTNTYVALEKSAKQWPDAPALTFFLDANKFQKKQTWTYSQLFADITRAANAFYQLGVSKDDVIAFVLPNLPETHFTIWGGEATGIVMAINPLLEGGQIAELIRSARATVLVTLAPTPNVDLWPKLRAHLQDMPDIRTVVWVNMAPYVGIKAPILHYLAMHEQHSIRNLQIVNLRSLMKKQPATHLLSGRVIQSQEPSSYFCTGGTTGLPKIAVRNHGNEVFDAWAITHLMNKPEQQQAKNVFCGLPLFHVNGQLVTGLMTWLRGDHVILGTPQGYRGVNVVKHFWQIVEHYQINLFSGVPTLYAGLMQQDANPYNISSLEYAICGAAPMPVELFRNFEQKTGVRILEGYGLTEGTCVSSINPPDGESRIGSIGLRLPWQAMKAIILDEQGQYQRDAQIDEVGVIVISGPNVFSGYLNPIHNKGLWIAIDGQQWLNTGDLGRQDKDGYFWLTGRKKELIIRGGHNIDPKSIEEPLHQHPAVAMAAAVGMPDAYAGELPVAYVELKPNSQSSEKELLAFLAEHIQERAAQPKYIRLIDKMPVTAVGKIFKPSLQMLEIERVILQECESLNIQLESLAVVQDNKRGLVAKLSYQGNTDILKAKLAQYTFTVEWL